MLSDADFTDYYNNLDLTSLVLEYFKHQKYLIQSEITFIGRSGDEHIINFVISMTSQNNEEEHLVDYHKIFDLFEYFSLS